MNIRHYVDVDLFTLFLFYVDFLLFSLLCRSYLIFLFPNLISFCAVITVIVVAAAMNLE